MKNIINRIRVPLWEKVLLWVIVAVYIGVIGGCFIRAAYCHGQHMDAPGSGSIVHTRYTPYKTFWWGIDTDGDSEPDRFVHVALIGDRLHYLDIISPNGR